MMWQHHAALSLVSSPASRRASCSRHRKSLCLGSCGARVIICRPNTKMWSKGELMATQTITIRVSPEAARVYNTATAEQQRKLEALLSLKLTEVARTTRPLEEIMSEMSRNAQARGLTPEILESLLNE